MKYRISISVDEATILAIQDILRTNARKGVYRNKSHFIEHAIQDFVGRQ